MDLMDVNVLVYAHRADTDEHASYARYLTERVESGVPFAVSEMVLSGFVRVVTSKRVFRAPSPTGTALEYCRRLLDRPSFRVIRPGPLHWTLFERLCKATNAAGKLVPDAYHAALAIEHGCTWISTDGDFARFRDLKWRHPLVAVGR